MKRSLFLLAFLCTPSWGAVALVQRSTGTYTAATTCSITTRAVGTGNYLAFGLADGGLANPTTVKSTNNTLVLLSSGIVTGLQTHFIYGLANSVSGDTNVTATFAVGVSGDCSFWEISGVATTNATDRVSKLDNGVQANPENGSAITPSNAGDFCVTGITPHTAVTSIATWTGSFPANGNGFAYLIPGATSTLTPSWTGDSGGGNYAAASACFLPAATATTTSCVSPFCGVIGKEE